MLGRRLVELLCEAARRDVHVRGLLWRSHSDKMRLNAQERQVALANGLRGDNPFSDARLIAMDYGREKIIKEDWRPREPCVHQLIATPAHAVLIRQQIVERNKAVARGLLERNLTCLEQLDVPAARRRPAVRCRHS